MVKTRVVLPALCLAILTVAGANLFAQDNKAVPHVSVVEGSSIIHTADAPPAGLIKLYSNLGSKTDTYYDSEGYTISGPQSEVGSSQAIAVAYTPTANSTIEAVQVALGYVAGVNSGGIAIFSDNNGLPGSPIKGWNAANLPTFGTCCTLATEGDAAGIKVTAGTQYWLVVGTDGVSITTWDAWDLTWNLISGNFAFEGNDSTGGAWTATSGTLPAYAIYGTTP